MTSDAQTAMPATIKVLPFGACQIGQPLGELHRIGRLRHAYTEVGFESAPYAYTVKAARQLFEITSGKTAVNPALAKFYFNPRGARSGWQQAAATGNHLAIIEPNYPIDIVMDGLVLSQQLVKRFLTDPLSELGLEVKKLCFRWKTKGLLEQNEDMRSAAAAALLNIIPDDFPDAEIIRAIIRQARGTIADPREVAADIAALRDALGIPCIMSLYTYRYADDGTPQTKPDGFRTEMQKTARRLDLPLLDLSGLVRRVGPANALREDRRHFSNPFIPLAARSMLYFLQKHAARLGIPDAMLQPQKRLSPKQERLQHLEAARAAEQSGTLGTALEHYRAMLAIDAGDTGALLGQRRVAQRLGLHAEAYEAAELLASREPHIAAHAAVLAKYARLAKAVPG